MREVDCILSVAWRASRTALVVLSVFEAELVAIQDGYLLSAGVRELMATIGHQHASIQIKNKTDNEAARKLAEEGGSWRTRHFCVKADGLRQQVALGLVEVMHIPGALQPADGLTKSLRITLLEQFRVALGLVVRQLP